MPYALVIIGLLMIVTGINDTYRQFGSQVAGDFTGNKSFIVWIVAIGSVGALGYVKELRSFSHYFMALIVISMVLANKGVFANFQAALKAGPATPQANPAATSTTGANSATTSTSGLTNPLPGGDTNTPTTTGQAKFNQYMNAILGLFGGS